MGEPEINLEELNERISALFERYKEELNGQEHSNVNFLLYNVNSATDILLYQVKFEIDQFMKSRIKTEGAADSKRQEWKNKKKAECLIKLQTLTSELTSRIMEDYKKKVDENRKRGYPM